MASRRVSYLLAIQESFERTFLKNHASEIAAIDFFVVPTMQTPYVERLIGSVRRECLDHVIVLNEWYLRRILRGYYEYYHEARTHQGLNNDCPVPWPVESRDIGEVASAPVLGGLHHRYWRTAA